MEHVMWSVTLLCVMCNVITEVKLRHYAKKKEKRES